MKLIALIAIVLWVSPAPGRDLWRDLSDYRDGNGNVRSRPVGEDLRNPWPAELEVEFQARANRILAAQASSKVAAGNTYFENEKRTYGYLMAQVLGPDGAGAVGYLQNEDAQAAEWHRETEGIDFYAAFTLKHQMRKYFHFGGLLDDAYRKRMFEGGRAWTARDPLRRPHPAFKGPKDGWGPDAKNSWVDVRSTENLFLMRVTSVYLMAEESDNRDTAALYKSQILDYVKTLYRVSMGEWDSENYHGHSVAPLLNLHDFARDPEVRLAAKACLDWFAIAGAMKYWRGGFTGPSKRDYNHAQPFGGSAACMLWVWFGDSPGDNPHWESDEVHMLTSGYRPPLAAVHLARRNFERPVEVFASKPAYEATTGFMSGSKPEYLETSYYGDSYQMGSLTGGTTPGRTDVNGFKILAFDSKAGAIALQAVPGPDPEFPGSPQYQPGKVAAENRVAQFGPIAIWLVRDGESPWVWVLPDSVRESRKGGVTFLKCERTWIAIRPLAVGELRRDDALSRKVSEDGKAVFRGHHVLSGRGTGGEYCGLVVETGEKESHGSFARFQEQVLRAEIDRSRLGEGIVRYKGADGRWLGIHWSDDALQLGVWTDGQRRDLSEHAAHLYRGGPVESRWGSGEITIEAGGARFHCRVSETGKVEFENGG